MNGLSRPQQLAVALLAVVLLAGCGPAPEPPTQAVLEVSSQPTESPGESAAAPSAASDPSPSPADTPPPSADASPSDAPSPSDEPSAAAPSPTPTGATPPTTDPTTEPVDSPTPMPTPSPSPIAGCPVPGSMLDVAGVATLKPACFSLEFRVKGWLDDTDESDGDAATLFSSVLRNRLPGTRASHRAGAWLPLRDEDANIRSEEQEGRWLVVRGRVQTDEGLCRWVFESGGEWEPEPPVWTCPRYLQVTSAEVAAPPAAQVADCPDVRKAIRVERFTAAPRLCFGTRTVALRGWLDTADVVGGWEDLWYPSPGWLWGSPIGRVTMLAPSSNVREEGSLVLRVKPGSGSLVARQNRWVVVRGHYARPAETEACRARSSVAGVRRPTGAPTKAEAEAACAREFVVESVKAGAPG